MYNLWTFYNKLDLVIQLFFIIWRIFSIFVGYKNLQEKVIVSKFFHQNKKCNLNVFSINNRKSTNAKKLFAILFPDNLDYVSFT